jgi:hypothetical protein
MKIPGISHIGSRGRVHHIVKKKIQVERKILNLFQISSWGPTEKTEFQGLRHYAKKKTFLEAQLFKWVVVVV